MIRHRFVRWLESIVLRALDLFFATLSTTHDRLEQRQSQAIMDQARDELSERWGVEL